MGYCSSRCFRSFERGDVAQERFERFRAHRDDRPTRANDRPSHDRRRRARASTTPSPQDAARSCPIARARGGGTHEESSPTDPRPRNIPIGTPSKSNQITHHTSTQIIHNTTPETPETHARAVPAPSPSTSDDSSHTHTHPRQPSKKSFSSTRNALDPTAATRRDDRSRRTHARVIMVRAEGPAIGIDLGTTYSCVGVWQHDRCVRVARAMGWWMGRFSPPRRRSRWKMMMGMAARETMDARWSAVMRRGTRGNAWFFLCVSFGRSSVGVGGRVEVESRRARGVSAATARRSHASRPSAGNVDGDDDARDGRRRG